MPSPSSPVTLAAGADAGTPAARPPVPLLRTLVFLGGFASIGTELATSRLIAPYFGSSTFIWATLIGLTLAFLSLGYWLGGRLADRRPSPALLYGLTAAAGVAVVLVPALARPILGTALAAFARYDVGAFYGALVGTLLLTAVPVTLLGFVSPFALRLCIADVASAGHTAGSATYKVHLDGYDQTALLRGSGPGARNEFFYFSDDGDLLAMRYGRLKIHFMVQNATGMDVWRKPFETLRAPIFFDLRSDPVERGQEGMGYNDWWYRHAFYAIPTQQLVGEFVASFKAFPPRQRPGSFTVGKALEMLSPPAASQQ